MPEPPLVPSRHQAGPRRTANGAGDITARKTDAVLGNRIDMGRGNVVPSLAAEFAISEVVGPGDQNIRFRPGAAAVCGAASRETVDVVTMRTRQTVNETMRKLRKRM